MTPDGLDARGTALWTAATTGVTVGPAAAVLLEEACRIADRLDRLHLILTGRPEEWARFRDARPDEVGDLVLVMSSALDEARQNAGALRQILATLGLAKLAGEAPAAKDILDELAQRRPRRSDASA